MKDSEEVRRLKGQLAERDALLRDTKDMLASELSYELFAKMALHIKRIDVTLSSSAEPSAQVELDERAEFESWMLNVAKIGIGSSDPYPAGLERDYWRVWQARAALERKL